MNRVAFCSGLTCAALALVAGCYSRDKAAQERIGACSASTTSCAGVCVDTRFDRVNCGECGIACGKEQVCSDGLCVAQCAGGTTKCGDRCVDTSVDPANCGACAMECGEGLVCSEATCGPGCAAGTTKCGSGCVDLQVDLANCGACGNACGGDQVCSGGTCMSFCSGGSTKCGSRCVDTSVDPANCGACAHRCAADQVCAAGACAVTCGGGSTKCGSSCVDLNTDPASCGQCGRACALTHATAACSAGVCVPVSCDSNFFDADRNAANGCECEKKIETCNNLDDDCDGLPDWFVDTNGLPRSACRCEPVRVAPLTGRADGDGGVGLCTAGPHPGQCMIDAQGALVMDFCVAARTTQAMWAQCIFESVSLEAFDADWGASGMLEIIYQTSAPLVGSVDMYYGGPAMAWPRRKLLSLSASTSLPAGNHRALIRPANAICPAYAGTPVSCLPPSYTSPIDCIPDACRAGCAGGRWSDKGAQCKFSYAGVPLWLTFESIPDNTPSQQARISVSSITYFPSTCACAQDADCRDGVHSVCDLAVLNAQQGVCKSP